MPTRFKLRTTEAAVMTISQTIKNHAALALLLDKNDRQKIIETTYGNHATDVAATGSPGCIGRGVVHGWHLPGRGGPLGDSARSNRLGPPATIAQRPNDSEARDHAETTGFGVAVLEE